MKVKVIKSFYDRSADMVLREEGSVFEADSGRATELKNLGFVEPVPKPENNQIRESLIIQCRAYALQQIVRGSL